MNTANDTTTQRSDPPAHGVDLAATPLLDFEHPTLQQLCRTRQWDKLALFDRVGAIYDFVRNEVAFGYNQSDDLPASSVLADGIGQCNTKGTLLMALLRASGVACRLHGFTIDKRLQKGAVTGLAYLLAPRSIIHSWVEVWLDGQWINLEGFILDQAYLSALQQRFPDTQAFCGYGAATPNLADPAVQWRGRSTYIQKEGINADLGVFDTPDDFYRRFGTNLTGLKRWLFTHVVRHQMNRNVARLRASGPHASARQPL
jgi:Transglutaminase-like superfamily